MSEDTPPVTPATTLEIEHKYLLRSVPALPPGAIAIRIEQGYLPDHGDADAEGRVRRSVNADGTVRLQHTIKKGHGLIRTEQERDLTPDEFNRLWPLTEGRRLAKTRHRVPAGDLCWEIDVFDDLDLVLAEIELPGPEVVAEIPDWLAPCVAREVTDEATFTNYEMALRGGARRDSESQPRSCGSGLGPRRGDG